MVVYPGEDRGVLMQGQVTCSCSFPWFTPVSVRNVHLLPKESDGDGKVVPAWHASCLPPGRCISHLQAFEMGNDSGNNARVVHAVSY